MLKNALYDSLGIGYNTTRKADPYIVGHLYELLQPIDGGSYLDIGCGTGNYTTALHARGLSFTGVEPSTTMLQEARAKSNSIPWLQGYVENIPLTAESMNGAIATFTTHHWQQHELGFAELYRVLKPGGHVVILTFTTQQVDGYWLNHYFPKMIQNTMGREVGYDATMAAACKAGFEIQTTEKYFVQPDLQDLFCYAGKHHPQMYFDPAVRSGISAFAVSADEAELQEGLAQLEQDISTGQFAAIKDNYNSDSGDYIFAVLRKGL
ncbi:class I SAM-dependent methyltransferase [Flavipsychrobacter stenotrophus]|uniref:Class I SAM-dependent methyltransferase n=1 Tax=Flavipsychrobacter stenotrophus TaxID=2077091 RepID=A0A2S7SYL7_9BACT|nr:class I SAM-dependent methyltransferase [Flavipsychrobacter stenotrophus]PQJ12040.1 class I SAM-dependent methyltransferase [Flavipsychrobacter stenotrophus]